MSRCVVCDRKPCSVYCGSGIDDLGDEIDRLKAENEKLKECLEYYAFRPENEISKDDGYHARQCLKELGE